MMRETKVGIVVGASFLGLVGSVVIIKQMDQHANKSVAVVPASPEANSHETQSPPPPPSSGTTPALPVMPKPLDVPAGPTPFTPPEGQTSGGGGVVIPSLTPISSGTGGGTVIPLNPDSSSNGPGALPPITSSMNGGSGDFDKMNAYFSETKRTRGLIGSGLLTKATSLWNATQVARLRTPAIDPSLRLVSDMTPITIPPTAPPAGGVSLPTPPAGGVSLPTPPAGGVSLPTPPASGVALPTPPAGGVSLPTPPDGGVALPTPPPKPTDIPPISLPGGSNTPMNGGATIPMSEPTKPAPMGVPTLVPLTDPMKPTTKPDEPPALNGGTVVPKLADPVTLPTAPKLNDPPTVIPKLANPTDPPATPKLANPGDPPALPMNPKPLDTKPIPIDLTPTPMPTTPMTPRTTPDLTPKSSGLEPVNVPKLGQPVVPMSDPTLEPAARFDPSRVQAPGPRQDADSYDEEWYHCKDGQTLASISQGAYYTEKYEQALRMYNLDRHPTDALRQDRPVMRAGDVIRIPPARVLERKYASVIPMTTAPRSAIPTAMSNNGGSSGLNAVPSSPLATLGTVQPDRTDGGNGPIEYEVTKPGMTLRDIAKEKLGNTDQWERIFRLNRWLNSDEAVPVGAKIYVPRSR